MPGLITHYICGEAVLRELKPECQKVIKQYRQFYNIGTQGPDIFFYYYPSLLRKVFSDLGTKMHNTNIGKYFESMIDSLSELEDKPRNAFMAYLSGYLTHYALDCAAHPYIYYKSGFRRGSSAVRELKYSVYHRRFETAIDVLMLKLVNSEKPAERKLWELIKISRKDANAISGVLSSAIQKTYSVPITERHIYKAMAYMVYTTRFLQSKGGKRKRLMELAESVTIKDKMLSSIIHQQDVADGIDYLNIKNKKWLRPWDDSDVQYSSFTDMFELSLKSSVEMVASLFDFINKKISKESLLAVIENKSMSSGLNLDENRPFKFSDIVFEG